MKTFDQEVNRTLHDLHVQIDLAYAREGRHSELERVLRKAASCIMTLHDPRRAKEGET